MILAIDPSAFVRRYVRGPGHGLVTEAMVDHPTWAAAALARTETLVLLADLAVTPTQRDLLWQAFHEDWNRCYAVPTDDALLAEAVELATGFRIRTVDAIHLAAAQRLPTPVRYLTFERSQIAAALALGFEVIAPADAP